MIPCPNSKSMNAPSIKDPHTAEKIELLAQQMNNITIPSLYFEYISSENLEYDTAELRQIFSEFGEVVDLIVKGKICIVLFKSFTDAIVCKEYFSKESYYKDNSKKYTNVKWFDFEKDKHLLSPEMEINFEKIHNKNAKNIMEHNENKIINMLNFGNKNKINNNTINNNNIKNNNKINNNINNINNNINNINVSMNNINQNNQNHININGNQNQNSNNIFINPKILMQYNKIKMNNGMSMNNMNNIPQNMHHMPNYGMQNMMMAPPSNMPMFMNQNLGGMNNMIGMSMNNHQYNPNQKQFNQNIEEKNYGKYTCKYEILIQNDKDFQVARRLIGSKGCNMKKILNECKNNNNVNDNIKLRLRGRGSGYKEGPQNKESDEPLHLCISAKNQEEMKKACAKVDDLLNKIYEEYKKFCAKNNITPVAPQLAKRIDCGNSLHKPK